MSIVDFFTIKTPWQRKKEQEEYNQWAFPYGQAQLDAVKALILELMPDEKSTGIAVYLIGREAYQSAEGHAPLDAAYDAMSPMLSGKHRKKLPLFLALVEADAYIDESLQYPDAQAIRDAAKRMEG